MDPLLRRLFVRAQGDPAAAAALPPHLDAPERPPGLFAEPTPRRFGARAAVEEDFWRALQLERERERMTHFGDTPRAAQPVVVEPSPPPRTSLTDMLLGAADGWRRAGEALDRQVERYTPPELRPLVSGAADVASYVVPDVPNSLEDVAYALEGDPYAQHRVAEGLAWMLAFAPLNFAGAGNAARAAR